MNKKIIISLCVMGVVAAVVVTGTTAYFSDTETSTGNTFTAGSIDLKIDNECHWSGGETCPWEVSDWSETDLEEGVHKFFYFTDIKPGDWGEDTISIHVYDNDAWGRIYFTGVTDLDNDCTEPELEDEPECKVDEDGELDNYMTAMMWLDQGLIPGFQGCDENGVCIDLLEGDNVWQIELEPEIYVDFIEDWEYPLTMVIANEFALYGPRPGLTEDGHMVGCVTYYVGLEWCFGEYIATPPEGLKVCNGKNVNNTPQTDSLGGNLTFQVEQLRNNPVPSWMLPQ